MVFPLYHKKMKELKNIKQLVTLKSAFDKDGRNLLPEDLCLINNASVIYNSQEILWVGPTGEEPCELSPSVSIDCSDLVVTPEVVDCHTHLVFGGNRAKEYTMRLNGADYQAIARAGGGILSTMQATNNASSEELFDLASGRIERIHQYGVGSIEIKSGYGLNYEKEYELSCLIWDLKKTYGNRIQIKNTSLAAHAVPAEFENSTEYLKTVVLPLLERFGRAAHREPIIDAVDIFHEEGYFNSEDAVLLYKKAKELGISVKCHADEFVDNKAALLACSHNALSADHLLKTGKDGIEALANSSTVAVFLPGTGFFLGKEQVDAQAFLRAGCKVAIGSDYNPGSCHFDNVLACAFMAAPIYKMNMAQLWASVSLNAAHAMGLMNQGAVIVGARPRFSFFKSHGFEEISYTWGQNFAVWPEGY